MKECYHCKASDKWQLRERLLRQKSIGYNTFPHYFFTHEKAVYYGLRAMSEYTIEEIKHIHKHDIDAGLHAALNHKV